MTSNRADPPLSKSAMPIVEELPSATKSDASKSEDGRRNNRPPEAGKIKPKEVRNPYGRRGKPKISSLSKFDEAFIAAAGRIVSHDANGPVDAMNRLVQEDWHGALVKGDDKARSRILAFAESVFARQASQHNDRLEWIIERKIAYTEMFATARSAKQPPPDVMHPDHVIVRDGEVRFTGPVDSESRKAWEHIKSAIKVAAFCHDQARRIMRRDPSPDNQEYLQGVETYRRKLMRSVPKGWDWREDIYCLHSETAFTTETIRRLQTVYDAQA